MLRRNGFCVERKWIISNKSEKKKKKKDLSFKTNFLITSATPGPTQVYTYLQHTNSLKHIVTNTHIDTNLHTHTYTHTHTHE